ncbi:MAG: hypothetical protein HQL30_05550 [Candidatus Omnitrophica bacterium]|nr:hypothetical protein [Candidatus Omnitrophota bacterium]
MKKYNMFRKTIACIIVCTFTFQQLTWADPELTGINKTSVNNNLAPECVSAVSPMGADGLARRELLAQLAQIMPSALFIADYLYKGCPFEHLESVVQNSLSPDTKGIRLGSVMPLSSLRSAVVSGRDKAEIPKKLDKDDAIVFLHISPAGTKRIIQLAREGSNAVVEMSGSKWDIPGYEARCEVISGQTKEEELLGNAAKASEDRGSTPDPRIRFVQDIGLDLYASTEVISEGIRKIIVHMRENSGDAAILKEDTEKIAAYFKELEEIKRNLLELPLDKILANRLDIDEEFVVGVKGMVWHKFGNLLMPLSMLVERMQNTGYKSVQPLVLLATTLDDIEAFLIKLIGIKRVVMGVDSYGGPKLDLLESYTPHPEESPGQPEASDLDDVILRIENDLDTIMDGAPEARVFHVRRVIEVYRDFTSGKNKKLFDSIVRGYIKARTPSERGYSVYLDRARMIFDELDDRSKKALLAGLILHDVGYRDNDRERNHAEIGRDIVEGILKQYGARDIEFMDNVCEIVAMHGYFNDFGVSSLPAYLRNSSPSLRKQLFIAAILDPAGRVGKIEEGSKYYNSNELSTALLEEYLNILLNIDTITPGEYLWMRAMRAGIPRGRQLTGPQELELDAVETAYLESAIARDPNLRGVWSTYIELHFKKLFMTLKKRGGKEYRERVAKIFKLLGYIACLNRRENPCDGATSIRYLHDSFEKGEQKRVLSGLEQLFEADIDAITLESVRRELEASGWTKAFGLNIKAEEGLITIIPPGAKRPEVEEHKAPADNSVRIQNIIGFSSKGDEELSEVLSILPGIINDWDEDTEVRAAAKKVYLQLRNRARGLPPTTAFREKDMGSYVEVHLNVTPNPLETQDIDSQFAKCMEEFNKVVSDKGYKEFHVLNNNIFVRADNNKGFNSRKVYLENLRRGYFQSKNWRVPTPTYIGQFPDDYADVSMGFIIIVPKDDTVKVEYKTKDVMVTLGGREVNVRSDYIVVDDVMTKKVFTGGVTVDDMVKGEFEQQSEACFRVLDAILKAEKLEFTDIVRQWNYLERIVDKEEDGRQRYQVFNDVRAIIYGRYDWDQVGYPAATGIGMTNGGVVLKFSAVKEKVNAAGEAAGVEIVPLDNTLQIPAHKYSKQMLEKGTQQQTPKFERAKAVVGGGNVRIYVSGTASIRDEVTVAMDNVEEQTRLTIENIEYLISRKNLMDHGIDAGATLGDVSIYRAYVKYEKDIYAVKKICLEKFGYTPCQIVVADVCRPNLLVEIEAIATTKGTMRDVKQRAGLAFQTLKGLDGPERMGVSRIVSELNGITDGIQAGAKGAKELEVIFKEMKERISGLLEDAKGIAADPERIPSQREITKWVLTMWNIYKDSRKLRKIAAKEELLGKDDMPLFNGLLDELAGTITESIVTIRGDIDGDDGVSPLFNDSGSIVRSAHAFRLINASRWSLGTLFVGVAFMMVFIFLQTHNVNPWLMAGIYLGAIYFVVTSFVLNKLFDRTTKEAESYFLEREKLPAKYAHELSRLFPMANDMGYAHDVVASFSENDRVRIMVHEMFSKPTPFIGHILGMIAMFPGVYFAMKYYRSFLEAVLRIKVAWLFSDVTRDLSGPFERKGSLTYVDWDKAMRAIHSYSDIGKVVKALREKIGVNVLEDGGVVDFENAIALLEDPVMLRMIMNGAIFEEKEPSWDPKPVDRVMGASEVNRWVWEKLSGEWFPEGPEFIAGLPHEMRAVAISAIRRAMANRDYKDIKPGIKRWLIDAGYATEEDTQHSPVLMKASRETFGRVVSSILAYDGKDVKKRFKDRYPGLVGPVLGLGEEISKVVGAEALKLALGGKLLASLLSPVRYVHTFSSLDHKGRAAPVAAFAPSMGRLALDERLLKTNNDFISFNIAHEIFEAVLADAYPDNAAFRELASHVFSLRLFLNSGEEYGKNILDVLESSPEYGIEGHISYASHLRKAAVIAAKVQKGDEALLSSVLFMESAELLNEDERFTGCDLSSIFPTSEKAWLTEKEVYAKFVEVLAVYRDMSGSEETGRETDPEGDTVSEAFMVTQDSVTRMEDLSGADEDLIPQFESLLKLFPEIGEGMINEVREFFYANYRDATVIWGEMAGDWRVTITGNDSVFISGDFWEKTGDKRIVLAEYIKSILNYLSSTEAYARAAELYGEIASGNNRLEYESPKPQKRHKEINNELKMLERAISRIARLSGEDASGIMKYFNAMADELTPETLRAFERNGLAPFSDEIKKKALHDYKRDPDFSLAFEKGYASHGPRGISELISKHIVPFIKKWGAGFSPTNMMNPMTAFMAEQEIVEFVLYGLRNYVREDREKFFREYHVNKTVALWSKELAENGRKITKAEAVQKKRELERSVPDDVIDIVLKAEIDEIRTTSMKQFEKKVHRRFLGWVKALYGGSGVKNPELIIAPIIGYFKVGFMEMCEEVVSGKGVRTPPARAGSFAEKNGAAGTGVDELYDARREFEITEATVNNRRTGCVFMGNDIAGYSRLYGKAGDGGEKETVKRDMLTPALRSHLEDILAGYDAMVNRQFPEGVKKEAEELRKDINMLEADSIVSGMMTLARAAKKKGVEFKIGIDPEWIPAYEEGKLNHDALSSLMSVINSLGDILRGQGMDNVVVVQREKGETTLDWAKRMGISEKAGKDTDHSNIVILAPKDAANIIDQKRLQGMDAEARPFIASVNPEKMKEAYKKCINTDGTELLEKQIPIKILEMLSLTLELATLKQGVEPDLSKIDFVKASTYNRRLRRIEYMPDADPVDYQLLINYYEAGKKALLAA